MADIRNLLKNLMLFKEPEKTEFFILKENENKKNDKDAKRDDELDEKFKTQENSKRDKSVIKKPVLTEEKENNKASKKDEGSEKTDTREYISRSIQDNKEYIKNKYSIPKNGDVVLREFQITFKDSSVDAFLVFIDGMTDRTVINSNILHPLMLLSNVEKKIEDENIGEHVYNRLLPHNQLKATKKFMEIIDEVNFGGCGIFVDGSEVAFAADVKGWQARGVERPNTELLIRGPQEGFNEVLRVNTALVRKIVKDEDLIVENAQVGLRSKTACSILYIKDIANDSLVEEVKRRINSIRVDYIIDSGQLEQYIEDNTFLLAPQISATERPDKVAAALTEGKIAVILNGSPFALVMPTTNNDLIKSPEDTYMRFPYGTLLRAIRILGVFMSLLLPGLYVAITNFHHEMIPTDLLLAIEAAREKVPFPTVVEILIMEVAFELIREAGIRIPGPIGPTLGIIGALILGQAAVAANIVSPILIIIVAVTGIGSFAIPNFSLALAFRALRFGYIFLGAAAGFLGITTGLFLLGIFFTSSKSFGVPYMAPFAPRTAGGMQNEFFRAPIWKQENRPDYLNPKDAKGQPKISRGWTQGSREGGKNEE